MRWSPAAGCSGSGIELVIGGTGTADGGVDSKNGWGKG